VFILLKGETQKKTSIYVHPLEDGDQPGGLAVLRFGVGRQERASGGGGWAKQMERKGPKYSGRWRSACTMTLSGKLSGKRIAGGLKRELAGGIGPGLTGRFPISRTRSEGKR